MKKHVVCISRQFASGGREVGLKLSEALGIPFYDKELIARCSQDHQIDETLLARNDERVKNSLLYSLAMGDATFFADRVTPFFEMPLNDQLFCAQSETIRKLAAQESCVIMGRCAGEILRDDPACRRVFILADDMFRQRRAREVYGVPEGKVEEMLRRKDKERATYFNYYSNSRWGRMGSYDLAVNSAKTGIDGAVQTILGYLRALEGPEA